MAASGIGHLLFLTHTSYLRCCCRLLDRVGTYNIVRKMPGGERLVALTRILHRTTPDEVMDEVRREQSTQLGGLLGLLVWSSAVRRSLVIRHPPPVVVWSSALSCPKQESVHLTSRVAVANISHLARLQIPTFIAQPLQPDCDKWCWFPVADRANAMQQFIDAAEKDPSMLKVRAVMLQRALGVCRSHAGTVPVCPRMHTRPRPMQTPKGSIGINYLCVHLPRAPSPSSPYAPPVRPTPHPVVPAQAPWLLLLETDYVWMKPLPDPGDAYDRSVPGWSFGFDYIAPSIPSECRRL